MSDGKTVGSSRERLVSGYNGRILLTFAFGWAIIQAGQFLIPPLLPRIIADLGITPFQAGLIVSVMSGAYALFQYPSGHLSDSLTRPTVFIPGLGLLVVGAVLLAGSPSYLPLLAGATVFGTGKALYGISARVYLSDLYVKRRGTALSVFGTGTDIGGILGSAAAIVALAVATWQAPFLAIGLILFCLLLALHHYVEEGYEFERTDFEVIVTFRRLLTTPRLRGLLVVYGLFWFANLSLLTFVPTFLQAEKGFSEGLASMLFALLFVVGIVVKPIGGVLSDRSSRTAIGSIALIISVIALTTIIVSPVLLLIAIGIVVYGIGQKPFSPVMDALLLDVAPEGKAGGDLGAMRTVAQGTGSLGPAVVGLIAQSSDYTVAFTVIAICFLICAVVLLLLRTRI